MGSGGLPPNVADFHGRTALHLATSNAHLAIMQFLVVQPVRPRSAGQQSQSFARHACCETVELPRRELRPDCAWEACRGASRRP